MAANPILPLATQYIPKLRRSGTEHWACCPFHAETTASFAVNPAKGLWHCWGACHVGGNAIDLVMRVERISFPSAVRLLADRGGVTLSDTPNANKDAYVAQIAAECAWWWSECRRRYSDREAAMVSCRNQPHENEGQYWLRHHYARSAVRWHRIITKLDATPPDVLLARYVAIRQKRPAVVRAYREHLEEERAWSKDWATFLAGL